MFCQVLDLTVRYETIGEKQIHFIGQPPSVYGTNSVALRNRCTWLSALTEITLKRYPPTAARAVAGASLHRGGGRETAGLELEAGWGVAAPAIRRVSGSRSRKSFLAS